MIGFIVSAILGLLLSALPNVLWKRRYGRKYIDATLLPLRKPYRICSTFGMILFMISGMFLSEQIAGSEECSSMMWIILPTLFMSNNRLFFEPYHTADIIPDLEELCLYLRPFAVSVKKNDWVKGSCGIPENLEKVLNEVLYKKVAKPYCIGDPNAAIPTTLSASGLYASDAEWKNAVTTLADKSRLIVVRVTETEGCLWELRHCVKHHLRKTIFLIGEGRQLQLLKKYVEVTNVVFPELDTETKKSLALYLDEELSQWHIAVLNSKSSIISMVNSYLEVHPTLKCQVVAERKVLHVITKPFRSLLVEYRWAHCITFLFQPLWYMGYNKWPKLWVFIYLMYAFVSLILCGIYVAGAPIFIAIWLLSFIPWLWLAPRITLACNAWGSKKITAIGNVVLCKWFAVYGVLTCIFTACQGLSLNRDEKLTALIETVMATDDSYTGYCPLETTIDSAFTSIYTDENVREKLMECIAVMECEDDVQYDVALSELYEAVLAVDEGLFCGWRVEHRFTCIDEEDVEVEYRCLIFVDEEYDSYYIFALDENVRYYNFDALKTIIDDFMLADWE